MKVYRVTYEGVDTWRSFFATNFDSVYAIAKLYREQNKIKGEVKAISLSEELDN